jgi:cohesin complex subunit SA-1/2
LDDITLVLIKALPRLFIKHQTDASRISKVLVIPQLMNIGMYLEMRLITAYETLWDDVSKQFMNHSSPTVLRRAVGTIGHMLSTASLQNTNKQKMTDLEEELGSAIRERIGERARATAGGRRPLETATLDEEEIRVLSTMLYRVSCLMSIRDMVGWMENTDGSEVRLLDVFTSLMERAKLGNADEDKVRVLISMISVVTHTLFR